MRFNEDKYCCMKLNGEIEFQNDSFWLKKMIISKQNSDDWQTKENFNNNKTNEKRINICYLIENTEIRFSVTIPTLWIQIRALLKIYYKSSYIFTNNSMTI